MERAVRIVPQGRAAVIRRQLPRVRLLLPRRRGDVCTTAAPIPRASGSTRIRVHRQLPLLIRVRLRPPRRPRGAIARPCAGIDGSHLRTRGVPTEAALGETVAVAGAAAHIECYHSGYKRVLLVNEKPTQLKVWWSASLMGAAAFIGLLFIASFGVALIGAAALYALTLFGGYRVRRRP